MDGCRDKPRSDWVATTGRHYAPAVETDPTTTVESDEAPPATTGGGGVDAVTVSIVDFRFDASEVVVPVGTAVRWVNDDSFAHTVVADDGSFMSDRIEPRRVVRVHVRVGGRVRLHLRSASVDDCVDQRCRLTTSERATSASFVEPCSTNPAGVGLRITGNKYRSSSAPSTGGEKEV